MVQWLRYVRHSEVEKMIARGWVPVNAAMGHHAAYSILMKWMGEGDPDA